MVSISSTSDAISSAATNGNPWSSDTIQNAIATLNDSKASSDDQLAAWTTVENLISSHPSQGGPARMAVVDNQGFTNFAARMNKIGDAKTGAASPSSTAQDKATLSPQAQSQVPQKDLTSGVNTMNAGDVALHLLRTAETAKAAKTVNTTSKTDATTDSKPHKAYQPGDVLDNKA